jgi:histidinol dehydrogenase
MQPLVWQKLSASRQAAALRRPAQSAQPAVAAAVRTIVAAVRRDGDAALRRLTRKFDGATLRSLRVTEAEFAAAEKSLSRTDLAALRTAYRNIRSFHAAQQPPSLRVETQPGIVCEKTVRPIGRVGLYVPGGSAPLPSTALMLGVPSQLAGNPGRVLCTPPDKTGRINPWILCAAQLCGITDIYKVGGAQAIAAMAYGTASIPKCDKLFGPGNAFVTEAKQQVARDTPWRRHRPARRTVRGAGHRRQPRQPAFVAADLLSQAEHGPDSQVVLVTFAEKFAARVQAAIEKQLTNLPRAAIARRALAKSRILIAANRAEAVEISNRYAPEHLILQVANPRSLAGRHHDRRFCFSRRPDARVARRLRQRHEPRPADLRLGPRLQRPGARRFSAHDDRANRQRRRLEKARPGRRATRAGRGPRRPPARRARAPG